MKIINENIGSASAVNVRPAPVKNSVKNNGNIGGGSAGTKRDHADFNKEILAYARKIKSSVKADYDIKQTVSKSSITSEEISAETERLKNRERRPVTLSGDGMISDTAAVSSENAAENLPENETPEISAKPDKSEAAEKLAEQKKQIFDLLGKHSGVLSKNVKEQLKTIYKLLGEQEKTDPDSISEPLQKEIDKLADIIKSEKDEMHKSVSEKLREQYKKLNSLFSTSSRDENSKNLNSIKTKIRRGLKLTPAERRYLSAKDPDAYDSYCKISQARSMFRCSLNNCRTKDEVIGMRLSNALSALSSYRKALKEGGNGETVIALNAAFENELKSYTGSSGYRSLPTAAECNKFDRDLAKAKKYEQEKRLEKQRQQRAKLYRKTALKIKTPGDGKRTVAQVMSDPTSKKVLASRAKRTYCECGTVGVSPYKGLNSKA